MRIQNNIGSNGYFNIYLMPGRYSNSQIYSGLDYANLLIKTPPAQISRLYNLGARKRVLAGSSGPLGCESVIYMVAQKMKDEEGFYYPHNIDFRGRAYPMPPHLNHLGSDLCRGVLEFAEGRPLRSPGLRWLKIELANLYAGGVDKLSYEGRLAFTENHLEDIFDSADRPLEGNRWWLQAEDPFQCLAVCINLTEALRCPSPETVLSHIPIHQDGSCNGFQHYAALGRDTVTSTAIDEMFEAARAIMRWFGECAKVKTSLQTLSLQRETDKVVVRRQRTAFPPNFIHSLDGCHMMMTAVTCKRAGLCFAGVHDSFWTHACDVDKLNKILREKFVELYAQPILENLLESFEKSFPHLDFPPLPERGDLDLKVVLDSPSSEIFEALSRSIDERFLQNRVSSQGLSSIKRVILLMLVESTLCWEALNDVALGRGDY
ncbi:hypothetical protein IGI04_041378 [Brassica rapa subsp. trilocularis]|uniref:DNA-directed RNA polymerase n=1 Tax=Brassica rapa subsp. trilocularis TaxID=1813537 RepID=A0ABQ7KS34_BRACM|nr:hypothetical protein IGI04_041378 [Brassica rapa subsp. trilocularis]